MSLLVNQNVFHHLFLNKYLDISFFLELVEYLDSVSGIIASLPPPPPPPPPNCQFSIGQIHTLSKNLLIVSSYSNYHLYVFFGPTVCYYVVSLVNATLNDVNCFCCPLISNWSLVPRVTFSASSLRP